MEAGILPIKALSRGKGRLVDPFGASGARRIAEALALDALDLVASVDGLEWWVVSDDPAIFDAGRARRLNVLADGGNGLNRAAGEGLRAAAAAGASSAVIIPADLPNARHEDIADLLDTVATSDVVLVPSGEDGGTNALAMSPPGVIEPSFGPGSLEAHILAAERLGLRFSVLVSDPLALDLDTYDDVVAFVSGPSRPTRAYEVCSTLLSEGA